MNGHLRFEHAAELFQTIPDICEDMTARPANGETIMAFVDSLEEGATPEEAITFFAYAMTPRMAVWWGHECLIHRGDLDENDQKWLKLVHDWVEDPGEESRSQALDQVNASEELSAPSMIAMAAAWSGGSMVTSADAPVPPPIHLTPRALNASLLTGIADLSIAQRRSEISNFIRIGKDLVGTS